MPHLREAIEKSIEQKYNDSVLETNRIANLEWLKITPQENIAIRKFGLQLYIREESFLDWKASKPLYMLWCASCNRQFVAYPQGYGEILKCNGCKREYELRKHMGSAFKVLTIFLAHMVLVRNASKSWLKQKLLGQYIDPPPYIK